ncbi:sulfotransferase family 2 domain-containing protein [Geminocystis sp. GBBB08]|uniref:sulfotransferase family 2 domain-containing protein n=1 Tax=Geminocystis sp. GBBB08 TaxID=2604140 RepID=UPI0027E33FFD|nr:sulfotransferase family 2 domain-containing protein [Geminocystis sp. GBBB08]MBL1209301.1 hypothetical protein [Geminocystis sp. GBBB08]
MQYTNIIKPNKYKSLNQKEKPVIIFTHIEKTAGTTLHSIINHNYNQEQIFTILHRESFSQTIESIKSQLSEKKIKIIKGHIAFGLHDYLDQEASYITMLRNPIKRVISAYYFRQNVPENTSMTLQEFCLTRGSNHMTTWLSGLDILYQIKLGHRELKKAKEVHSFLLTDYYNQESLKLLDKAKANLRDYFQVIGITEKFDESLLLFKHFLGWQNIYYYRQRVANNKPPDSTFSPEVIKFIRDHNQLDIKLYEYALELFEKQIIQYGINFQADLKKFKNFNSFMGIIYQTKDKIKQVFK